MRVIVFAFRAYADTLGFVAIARQLIDALGRDVEGEGMMADETIIEKAMALLPGGGSAKKRASAAATRNKLIGAIQRKLAAVAKNVEKLAGQIKAEGKKAAGKTSKRPPPKRPPARKTPTRKPGRRSA